MRNRFADIFYDLGRDDPRLCLVVADISPAGSIARFRTEFPGRFVNTGVAEQVMIGMTAGMAQRGLRPFAYTIATFALFRPFEFIRNDLCYQGLPVTIVGIGGGITYSTLGGTHHAMEDIGVASAIPNMSVIAPCDPDEVEAATRWCAGQTENPVYLRLGRAGEPALSDKSDEPWAYGKLRAIQRGGEDVAVISYGPIMAKAVELADMLRSRGEAVSVFSSHTLKPLDRERLSDVAHRFKRIVVVEETTPNGSLGQRLKEIAWDCGAQCRIDAFCLQDRFIHHYGSYDDLLAVHGLDAQLILDALEPLESTARA